MADNAVPDRDRTKKGALRSAPTVGKTKALPAFRRMVGQQYLSFMSDMHSSLKPEWYLEIGTQNGRSLALSTARSVAIDPEFKLSLDAVGTKPELHLVQATSDDFFADGFLERLGKKIDLAFLDGMHRYEFLLRDFMNTERHMSTSGHVLLHDCVPWNEGMSVRDQSQSPTKAWTGDVWKVVPILAKYRPDLKVDIYDCAPTGLVVVSKLDPKNKVLESKYDKIIAEFDPLDNVQETVGGFDIVPATSSPWTSAKARKRSKTLSFAIQVAIPRPRGQSAWGDYHFAVGVAEALKRKGCEARVQTRKHWSVVEHENEVDLVIRGLEPYVRRGDHHMMHWLISNNGSEIESELEDTDHIFAASGIVTKNLAKLYGPDKVTLLPQAFDADRMRPPDPKAQRDGILFVGLARRWERPIVNFARTTGTEISVWGRGWERTAFAHWHKGEHIDNARLGEHYGSAMIVLNDHTPMMREAGLTSNRIFDALACAAPVISDNVAWLPDEFREFVELVDTPEDFRAAVTRIEAEGKRKSTARRKFAESMRDTHSFDARVDQIIETAQRLAK